MADPSTCLPLTPDSISKTYDRIKQYIHKTPLITSRSLNHIASHLDPRSFLSDNPPPIWSDPPPPSSSSAATTTTSLPPPKLNLFLKLESHQRIGAFKARGAFSAITHLINEVGLDSLQKRGVITHSSGNHAQALALAASTFKIPAWIVMPSISTKSKIAGVRSFEHAGAGVKVIFSGSTAPEREAKVAEVIESQAQSNGSSDSNEGPIIVPPYDHPDIILGQGTVALEMEAQFQNRQSGLAQGCAGASGVTSNNDNDNPNFDIILTPLGGGGLLSGVATWFSHTHTASSSDLHHHKTLTIGTEPSFQGANDAEIGLSQNKRIPHVRTLTIADGLRTPVGVIPWSIISDSKKTVESVFSVTELEIKMALKILVERVKVVVEPSSAVPVAVVLFNARFREWVEQRRRMESEARKARGEDNDGEERTWNVGIVLSGGNTTVEGLSELFRGGWLDEKEDGDREEGKERQRETGQVGMDGKKVAEDVAG